MMPEKLRRYWEDVRAGRRPGPTKSNVRTHRLHVTLDGTFGSDRGRRVYLAVHPNGVIELRLSKCPRRESVHIVDVYRYAIRCRVNKALLEKARLKKEQKATRLARQRQERAERRLIHRGDR